MKTSTEIVKITGAFLKAQKEIESVIKDKTNPFFKSKYADLTGVIDACKDKLNKQGIAILQPIDGMTVETILIHDSGEWFSSSTPIVSKEVNNPQALGSAITYAKRYGLQSMVLLPASDDDGQLASKEVPTKTVTPSVTATVTKTPTLTPTPTLSGFALTGGTTNTQNGTIVYEDCITCSGNTYTQALPHAIYSNAQGRSVVQVDSVALGGFNGLNS